MSLKLNFELMADYNKWMNERIYESASQLDSSALAENRGAFFNSIMGTLNHILVGDTIWLKRFSSHPEQFKSLEYVRCLNMPKALNAILFDDLEVLTSARKKMDLVIQEFTYELSDDVVSSLLSYSNTKGEAYTKNFGHLIQHFFNHQTHHRGQISTLLNQIGVSVGNTDLLACVPSE